MKTLLTSSILIFCSLFASGQSYGEYMMQIIERSPQLRTLQASSTADSLAARRGLNPMDPSVEVDYFFGKESTMEMTITQDFDFPTVYHQRNKIARHSIERTQAEFMAARRALLFEASELFNTLVYQTNLLKILNSRADNYRRLDTATTRSYEAGNTTALEQSKLRMMLNSTINELTEATAAQQATLASIAQFGVTLNPEELQFANYNFSGASSDFVEAAIAGDWVIQAARVDSLIAGRALKLARAEWAPGLKVGYKIDADMRSSGAAAPRHGLVAGVTLPLWQNRNNVKQSKAQINATSANLRAAESTLRTNLNNLYQAYMASETAWQQWANVNMDNYYSMMEKSLKAGSVSLMQYLLEMSDTQDTERQILEARYRTAQLGGQMALYLY